MSILSEPRKPDCDVCDWATAYHYAYGMNLCSADLDIANKVAESERDRIIKLLEDSKCECEHWTQEQKFASRKAEAGSNRGMWWHQDCGFDTDLINYRIALIKGENK